MVGFEWWTGSFGQWLFVAMVIVPMIFAGAFSYLERRRRMSREDWFKLPLTLRQRWWRETDYSRTPPSDELMAAVRAALETK